MCKCENVRRLLLASEWNLNESYYSLCRSFVSVCALYASFTMYNTPFCTHASPLTFNTLHVQIIHPSATTLLPLRQRASGPCSTSCIFFSFFPPKLCSIRDPQTQPIGLVFLCFFSCRFHWISISILLHLIPAVEIEKKKIVLISTVHEKLKHSNWI